MRFNSLTIDDFYADPMQVREFALKQEFKVRGNYPGQRTESFLTDSIKQKLRDILEYTPINTAQSQQQKMFLLNPTNEQQMDMKQNKLAKGPVIMPFRAE